MASLWHFRGSVSLDPTIANEVAIDRIEAMLRRRRKPIAERGTDFVAFSHPIWGFATGWGALAAYDQGVFWIAGGTGGLQLQYRLRSLHAFIFYLFTALMFFTFGLVHESLSRGLFMGVFAFAWLYGMNMLFAGLRVPKLIETALSP